jgi:ubiquinone/menaquinone biosynthesis C-methylase UbiE
MKIGKIVSILTILLNASVFNVQSYASYQVEASNYLKKSSPFSPELINRQSQRAEIKETEKLMDVLRIKPGMTILDIGAGSGQYSYKFAERLKGTGRVFATDINADMIRYIKRQARARNFSNLFPVLVKPLGLDKFYAKNKFDLIFVAHTYHYLRDRVAFFKNLRGSLSSNGRLVILNRKNFSKLSLGDISDFEGLIKQLLSEKTDSPFYAHLQESTQKLLRGPLNDEAKKTLKKLIIEDFNSMINDIYFLSNFVKRGLISEEGVHFTPEERSFVNWAWQYLKVEDKVVNDEGVLKVNNSYLNAKHYSYMRSINAILIVQEFRIYLYNGKPAVYLPGGYGSLQENSAIENELASAGYLLEDKYDFIPFEIISVFKANETLN